MVSVRWTQALSCHLVKVIPKMFELNPQIRAITQKSGRIASKKAATYVFHFFCTGTVRFLVSEAYCNLGHVEVPGRDV